MYIRGEISTGRRGSVGAMREHRNAEDLIIDSIAKKQRVADGQIKKSSGFLKLNGMERRVGRQDRRWEWAHAASFVLKEYALCF